MIREALFSDADTIAEIYNYYVSNTVITFEETPVTAAEMATRIKAVKESDLPWLVLTENDRIVGYAYATLFKARSAYRFSVESTVYLSPEHQRNGHGTRLYEKLIDELRALGIQNVIGCVTLPNPASVGLHEKMQMKKVGHFSKIGFKFEQWLDVGFWQRNLLKPD